MVLTLMRGGASNAEVLLASTPDDFLAIARKYSIELPGQEPARHIEPLPAPVFA